MLIWAKSIRKKFVFVAKQTSEIYETKEWKEENIKNRNIDIANRACAATISPLPRERLYQTKNISEEFTEGVYPITDLSTSMSGTHISAILYDEKVYAISLWKEFLQMVCTIAYDFDSNIMKKIVRENNIHKATSAKNYPDKDPIITNKPELLVSPKEIKNSGIFIEGCVSSYRARVYAKQLLDIYGISDDFQIQVEK